MARLEQELQSYKVRDEGSQLVTLTLKLDSEPFRDLNRLPGSIDEFQVMDPFHSDVAPAVHAAFNWIYSAKLTCREINDI